MEWKETFRKGFDKLICYLWQCHNNIKRWGSILQISPKSKMIIRSFSAGLLFALISITLILYVVPAIQQAIFLSVNKSQEQLSEQELLVANKKSSELIKSLTRLEKKLAKQIPQSTYMIVNISDNRFYVYRKEVLLRQGKCSTGSYIKLEYDDKEHWVFKTPRGEYSIKGKTESPVWKKPDWAFREEGLPVPSANDPSRFEYGVLGDYALSLGSGYLIHGTLYQRLLGMPVTHGCVRLNDEDLEYVYKTLNVGSKVIMY